MDTDKRKKFGVDFDAGALRRDFLASRGVTVRRPLVSEPLPQKKMELVVESAERGQILASHRLKELIQRFWCFRHGERDYRRWFGDRSRRQAVP